MNVANPVPKVIQRASWPAVLVDVVVQRKPTLIECPSWLWTLSWALSRLRHW